MIKFYFFGKPRILIDSKDITKYISSKAVGILAYLIINKEEQKVSREKIAYMFWDESARESAKYNLRYTLWSIKKIMKENGIHEDIILSCDKDYCMINEGIKIWSDVDTLCNLSNEIEKEIGESAEEFLDIYKGDFLENISLRGNPGLDDWIIYQKEYFQRSYFNGVLKLANVFSSKGEYKKSIECLEKLLYINPLDEDIHRRLMEYYYLEGDRAAAIKQYKKCTAILRNELNISPMDITVKLYNKIKDGNEYIITNNKSHESSNFKYPEFFVLTEILETIIKNSPDIVNRIDNIYLYEISKLIPEIQVNYSSNISYISPEIEKLRIFKSICKILKETPRKNVFEFQFSNKMDHTSLEFLSYLSIKNPSIEIMSNDNNLTIQF